MRGGGSQSATNFVMRSHVHPPFWLRRRSVRRQRSVRAPGYWSGPHSRRSGQPGPASAISLLFSEALLEALSGKADSFHNGVITVAGLEAWLGERVKTLTEGRQHPTSAKPATIQNFPISMVR
jgi:hypothetical protein